MPRVVVAIDTTYKGSGTDAARQGLLGVGKEASKAEKSILSYAQALAAQQRASGNLAGAQQTLVAALRQVDQATKQAINTEKQLIAVQSQIQGSAKGLQVLPRTLDGISGSALGAVKTLTGVGSALAAIGAGADLAQLGAQAALVNTRFDSLAKSANTTGDALLAALRKGSGGEISDLSLQLAANKAQLLDVAHSAEEFGVLMNVARDRAQQMGISTTQAFDDLVTGLGRGSRLILDNLGIIVNADAANQAYAASIGKTVAALTDQERKQALINQVLKDGAATMAATGGAVESSAGKFAQLSAGVENAKAALGGLIAVSVDDWAARAGQGLQIVADGLNQLTSTGQQLQAFSVRAFEGARSLEDYQARVAGVNSQLAPFATHIASLSDASYEYARALQAGGASAEEAFAKAQQYGGIVEQVTAAQTAAGVAAGDWGSQTQTLGQQVAQLAATSDANRAAVENLVTAYSLGGMTSTQFAAAIAVLEQQHRAATQAAQYEAVEEARLATAHNLVHGAVSQETQALVDEIAKKQQSQIEAAKLAQVQATLAQLGGAVAGGLQTAGAAATVLANRYNIAYAEAVKLINAQAALARMTGTAGPAGPVRESRGLELEKSEERRTALKQRQVRARTQMEVDAARREQTLAVGTTAQKQALLQQEYDTAVRLYGANSAAAIKAQTALLQAQERGGAARAGAASAGGTKLASIEQATGNKITDIADKTADKLAEIDARAAERRAEAYRKLQADIAASAADFRASSEANDLDLIGVDDEKQAARLNDRERAEADSRRRMEEAAAEARSRAEAGEAEAAGAIYDIRQKQIADQQALDEKYYERQRELAESPEQLAALQQQYEEATRATAEAAQVRIDLANAEAAQRKVAIEEEKAAVIAAADEQAAKVTGRAQQSAAAVKAASADARAKAVADLKAIGDAVNQIPANKTINVSVQQSGAKTTGGSTAAAGGGTFLSHGPTTMTVGDNPGGVELVSVTPLSGRGQTRVGGGMMRLAGGGTVLVDAGNGFTTPVAGSDITKPGKGKKGKSGAAQQSVKDALDEQRAIVALLSDMVQLRHDLEEELRNGQPFNVEAVNWLAKRAALFTQMVKQSLIPLTKQDGESLKLYTSAARDSVSLLGDMAGLRHDLQDAAKEQPFDMAVINGLVIRARQFTDMVRAALVPTTEAQASQVQRYADAVGSTVSVLKDTAGLRKDLQEVGPPIDDALIVRLADEAMRITRIVLDRLLPTTKEQAEALSLYADTVGSGTSALKSVLDLSGKLFADYTSPSDAQIGMLATDAQRITKGFMDAGQIMGKDAAEAGKMYAEGVGAAFSAAKEGLLVIDALKSGDFVLPEQALAQFRAGSLSILDTMEALAGRASQIPAGDIAALQTTTAALAAQSEALIRLAAVPWGDLPAASAGLAQQVGVQGAGGGAAPIVVNIYNPPAGVDVPGLIRQVEQGLAQKMRSYR